MMKRAPLTAPPRVKTLHAKHAILRVATTIILLLVGAFATIPTISSQTAHAINLIPETCYDIGIDRPLKSRDTGLAAIIDASGGGTLPSSVYSVAGASFSYYYPEGADNAGTARGGSVPDYSNSGSQENPDSECMSALGAVTWGRSFSTGLNTLLFSITTLMYQIVAWMFQNAYSSYIGDIIVNTIDEPIKVMRDNFVWDGMVVAVVLAGMWVAYKQVKSQVREALSGAAWTIVGSVVIGLMLYFPHAVPNAVADLTNAANTSILQVATSANSVDYCASVVNDNDPLGHHSQDKAHLPAGSIQAGTCAMWSTFVFTPWSQAQYGVSPGETQVVNGQPAPAVAGVPTNMWAMYQYAAQTKLANEPEKGDQFQMEKFAKVVDAQFAGSDSDRTLWVGDNGSSQFVTVLISIIAMAIGAWLIGSISVKVMTYNVLVSVLLFFLPFVGVITPHPTIGKRGLFKYVGYIVGFGIRPIIYTMGMTVAMIIFSATTSKVASGEIGWFTSIVVLAVVAFAIKQGIEMMERMFQSGPLGTSQESSLMAKGKVGAASFIGGALGGLAGAARGATQGRKPVPATAGAGKPGNTPPTQGTPGTTPRQKDNTLPGKPNTDAPGFIPSRELRDQQNAAQQASEEADSAVKRHQRLRDGEETTPEELLRKTRGEAIDRKREQIAQQQKLEALQKQRQARREYHRKQSGIDTAQTPAERREASRRYMRAIAEDKKRDLADAFQHSRVGRVSMERATQARQKVMSAREALERRESYKKARSAGAKAIQGARVARAWTQPVTQGAGALAKGAGRAGVGVVSGAARGARRGLRQRQLRNALNMHYV